MRLVIFLLTACLVISCRANNHVNAAQKAREMAATIGNGQPELFRLPAYHFYTAQYLPKAESPLQVSDYIRCMLQDTKGNIWFGTNSDGVCRYANGQMFYLSTRTGLSGDAVRGIAEDADGNIWLATNGGVSRYDGRRITNYGQKEGLAYADCWSLLCDSKNQIWVGTLGGVFRLAQERFVAFALPGEKTANSYSRFSPKLAWRIFEDRDGATWFGTDGNGAFRYAEGEFTHFTEKQGLAANNVLSVTQDKQGNIWMGTWGNGLCKYNGKTFISYNKKDGLSCENVWSLTTDREGNVWAGTLGGGVCKYDGKTFTNYLENEGVTFNHVQSILQDKNGNMWFGFSGGVFRLRNNELINFVRPSGC